MQIELLAAGHLGPWTFRDATILQGWLKDCPWQRAGGICGLEVNSDVVWSGLKEAIRGAIYQADLGASSLRFRDADVDARGLEVALSEALGFAPPTAEEGRSKFVDRLVDGANLVALRTPRRFLPEVLRRAVTLVDMAAQLARHATLTLFIAAEQQPNTQWNVPWFDLRYGLPVNTPAIGGPGGWTEAWKTYVRLRLSWEMGGDADATTGAWDHHADVLRRPNDHALEQVLDQFPIPFGDSELRSLAAKLDDAYGLHRECPTLLEGSMGWSPPGFPGRALRPLLARRLLVRCRTPGAREWLRHSLICRPLADTLLAQALRLEGEARGFVYAHLQSPLPSPPDAAQGLHERITGSIDAQDWEPWMVEAQDDTWGLASLGEFLSSARNRAANVPFDSLVRLSRLRNALAHNGYARWFHVKELHSIAAQVDPSRWGAIDHVA